MSPALPAEDLFDLAYDGRRIETDCSPRNCWEGWANPRAHENNDGLVTMKGLGDFSRKQTMRLSAIR
ncbi:hypothetical protein SAMN05216428_104107 [Nitrosospira sp. Nsp11]|uniref:hypothetical protein n=1 Tax=Nitrosospira sp. Nsp11 TaxID=1855338 RepID=UPI00091EA8F8|nr:hypothetical protein [Nitrosospira sp. Nsp11]SHL62408.1 hypothetical protein SAMN05216428_104107 [Nitrosospira sp. Nsp11]